MESFGTIRMLMPCAIVTSVIFLTGCATTNVSELPTDAAATISSFVSNAQDAQRASNALGWGTTVSPGTLAAKPAPIDTFKAELCQLPLFEAAMAAKAFQSFNSDVTDLAKAPDDSLGSYLRALNEHHKQLKEIGKSNNPPTNYQELNAKLIQKCSPLVDRDLSLTGGLEPLASPTVAINLILAFAKFATSIAEIAEKQERAKLIKNYVAAHESEVRQAMKILSAPNGLQAVVQTTRTYYVRRAYASYSDLTEIRKSDGSAHATPLGRAGADEYAQFAAKYLKLQNVDAVKLMNDADSGLNNAYDKFIVQVQQPNADPVTALDTFLGFLKSITEINTNRTDFLKALKDMQDGSTP